MNIRESTVLVTGANRGLGRALSEVLLERGARRVYAAARNPANLYGLTSGTKNRVVPVVLDVTVAEHVERAAELASDVNIVVSNAGTLASYGVLADNPAELRRDMETNFFGFFNLARAFAPVLEKQRRSSLVSILSIASLANMPMIGGYSTSKAAAWSLTQALRAELSPRGIVTHAAFPGPIDTEMVRDFPMQKTPPKVVAGAILDALEAGTLDIYPDAVSKDTGALFARDPLELARRFAAPPA